MNKTGGKKSRDTLPLRGGEEVGKDRSVNLGKYFWEDFPWLLFPGAGGGINL